MDMEKGNKQLLRDPSVPPTAELIARSLGGANDVFVKFSSGLGEHGISLMDWKYYNDGKAWLSKGEYKWTTPRGANKVKPVFWLSVWDGFFKVSFFFSENARDELLSLPLNGETKSLIESAKPMGKTMKFVPVIFDIKSSEQLNDMYIVALFKKSI